MSQESFVKGAHVPIVIRDTLDGRGKGIFAVNDISKGTLIWSMNDNVQCFENEKELQEKLNSFDKYDDKRDFVVHLYPWKGKVYKILDGQDFVNHSDEPNCGSFSSENDQINDNLFAIRDIKEGEELLEDYRTFDCNIEWWKDKIHEYNIWWPVKL